MYSEIMLDMLPEYLSKSKYFTSIVDIIGKEFDSIKIDIDDLILQLSPLTCTWSINLWEKQFGLPSDNNIPIDIRRGKIAAKLAVVSPLTCARFEEILSNFAYNVKVTNIPGEYSFNVEFDISNNADVVLENVEDIIETYKPAHLGFIVSFGFRTNIEIQSDFKVYENRCLMCGTFKTSKIHL